MRINEIVKKDLKKTPNTESAKGREDDSSSILPLLALGAGGFLFISSISKKNNTDQPPPTVPPEVPDGNKPTEPPVVPPPVVTPPEPPIQPPVQPPEPERPPEPDRPVIPPPPVELDFDSQILKDYGLKPGTVACATLSQRMKYLKEFSFESESYGWFADTTDIECQMGILYDPTLYLFSGGIDIRPKGSHYPREPQYPQTLRDLEWHGRQNHTAVISSAFWLGSHLPRFDGSSRYLNSELGVGNRGLSAHILHYKKRGGRKYGFEILKDAMTANASDYGEFYQSSTRLVNSPIMCASMMIRSTRNSSNPYDRDLGLIFNGDAIIADHSIRDVDFYGEYRSGFVLPLSHVTLREIVVKGRTCLLLKASGHVLSCIVFKSARRRTIFIR